MTELLQPEIVRTNGAILVKYAGDALKRTGERTFEGHIIRWHNPNPDKPRLDLTGEWFSNKTYLMRNAGYPIIGMPINYQHGQTKEFGAQAFGLVDFTEEDEIGQFIRGQLKDYEDYLAMLKEIGRLEDRRLTDAQLARKAALAVKAVDTLIASIPLRFSGGFDPSTWIVNEDTKHIDQAGTIHGAFTPTPADDLNPVITFKSAWAEVMKPESNTSYSLPYIHADVSQIGGMVPGQEPDRESVTRADVEPPQANAATNELTPAEEPNMDMEQLKELIRVVLAEFGITAQGEQTPALPPEEEVLASIRADAPTEEPKDEAEMAKSVAKVMDSARAYVTAWRGKKQKMLDLARENSKRHMPAIDDLPAGGNGSSKKSRISVGESRKYAHLTAEEMALAVKVAEASYHPNGRNRLTFNTLIDDGFITPEFVRTWQHKAAVVASNFKAQPDMLGRQSESAIKSLHFLKADELNSTDITGQGLELTSVYYDNVMWERAREKTELFNLLVQRGMMVKDIPDGAKTANFKIDTSSPTVYTRHQARSVDATGRPEVTARITPLGTDDVEVTPAEHVLATSATDILTEDSIVDIVRYLNADIERTLGSEALEDSFINGDIETGANANINLIDDTPATGLLRPLYIAFDGFRKHALVTYSGQSNNEGAALSIDTYFDTVAEYDDNAIESRTKELLYIVDKDTHRASRKLPELLTPGVAMEGATIYVGELPPIDGMPIYRSGFLRKSNTAGKISVTAGNNTKGQILNIYPYYWGYARKRAILIENDRDIMAGATVFVASIRHALIARSAKAATISYNITV